jgi:hypothetical protein
MDSGDPGDVPVRRWSPFNSIEWIHGLIPFPFRPVHPERLSIPLNGFLDFIVGAGSDSMVLAFNSIEWIRGMGAPGQG